jgi:phenol 2-monooxygenase (NADPH)
MASECESKPSSAYPKVTKTAGSIPGRVWTFMENIKDTAYDFVLVLRQMYTEAILREKLESIGATYYQSTECIDFKIDEAVDADSYAVTSIFNDKRTQTNFELKR